MEADLTQCVTCDCFNENDKLKERIEQLEGKTYGWCNTCGSLVVGGIEHLCDKCGGGKVIFEHEIELVGLKKRTKRLEDTMKDVCDYIKATGKVNKWKILNWLEQKG